ncbi:Nucleic acid-binding, OB-fold [Sesbania bispinosa]|nr:Nucleic acid-binding, OB-fold [Sesbania bispinosa]
MALVNGPIDMVRNICGVKDSWRLKVRVVRLWKSCSKNDPKKVFSLEMVLVDAEGARIQASIRKPMIRKFADVVVEGEVYKMIHFVVVKNLGNIRATKHEFKLIFNSRTTVFRAESQLIPEFGLSLSSSEDIRKTKGESEYLGKIRCTLFEDYVDKVNEFLSLSGTQLTVVVIQFARVNTYKGEVGLVNVFNTSRLFVACHEVDSDICIGFLDDDIQSLSMKDEF